jgi:endo-1,4-beta-mannosidase
MTRIKELGCNSIKIFLQYEDFGKENVSTEKINRLLHFLDLVHHAELSVMITLFDFYGDYSAQDWRATAQHLRLLIPAVRSHPALLAYDLKNEPDLDFESRGETLITDWLSYHMDIIRSLDPDHPITIGWSNPEDGFVLSDKVDFVSYHYYGETKDFVQRHEHLTSLTNKTTILTEYGMTSYRGLWNPIQFSQKKQASLYADLLDNIESLNISSFSWTLHDFHQVPVSVVGRRPWRRAYQRHYGLIDTDGNPKPAFNILARSTQDPPE